MQDAQPTDIDQLKQRIEQHRNRLLDYVHCQPETAVIEVRDSAGWSAKDHVAHVARWERSIAYLLRIRPRHQGLGVREATYASHDVDLINDEIYRQRRDEHLETVLEDLDAVHADLLEILDELTWEELQFGYSHYAPQEAGDESGEPVIYWVARNTYSHYDEHLTWIRELLESDRARSLGY